MFLMHSGNPVIPTADPNFATIDQHLTDFFTYHTQDYHWLLDEYNWKAIAAGYYMDLEAEKTSAHIPGFGATPNCHMRLKNIAESVNTYDTAGITRGDAGIGAFTGYHNRTTRALKDIRAGQELYVDYGPAWFLSRESYMGLVPLAKNYPVATKFLEQFRSNDALKSLMFTMEMGKPMLEFWDLIINFPYKSRSQSALPKNLTAAIKAAKEGIYESELWQSTRSLEELERSGKCLDNIRYAKSSIPSAGREGGLVAPAPLLHVPDRGILKMFADKVDPRTGEEYRDISKPAGQQLLLNYCFGHGSSSMLLCPYGHETAYINHDSRSPNTKIIWSTDAMYHNATLLEQPVEYFDNIWSSVVGFDYIALRDIKEGEEITIDYGSEWEEAWNEHVQNWVPPEGHKQFVPPQDLNADKSSPLRTFAEDKTMYSDHIDLYCLFSSESILDGKDEWDEDELDANDHKVHRILERRMVHEEGEPEYYVYDLELLVPIEDESEKMAVYAVKNVPREAISFYYKQYHSDMFVKGAFRHEMMIPNHMFPRAWRNID
ncbi:hypothetical protein ACHAXN_010406 [Cyclotella atomus]